MNVYSFRSLKISGLVLIASLGIKAFADDFQDIAGYEDVNIGTEESIDASAAEDISDAIGNDADMPPRADETAKEERESATASRFTNATPEPQMDSGMSGLSEMGHKLAKHKVKKVSKAKTKVKKSKKIAKASKSKKRSNAKKRTLARN